MSIREPGSSGAVAPEAQDPQTTADEDYARQLQAKLDAQEARKG
jgi:hypothetical protein